jgi:hypothetical protein
MIYERINTTMTHHVCHGLPLFRNHGDQYTPKDMAMIVFVNRCLPISILSTCRLAYQEAYPVLLPKLEDLVDDPLHFVVDMAGSNMLTDNHILDMCFS